MDLEQVLKVVWRRKSLVVLSVIIGSLLAFNVLGQSYTTYETSLTLILDNADFALGRAVYRLERGDSIARTTDLAPVYAALLTSDKTLDEAFSKVGERPRSVVAEPVSDSPLITLTVKGVREAVVMNTAKEVADVFIKDMVEQQNANNIAPADRVVTSILSSPAKPRAIESRRTEIAALYFLAPVATALFAVFVMENLAMSSAPNPRAQTEPAIPEPRVARRDQE